MVKVTSADMQKQFGLYREIAIREAVTVTHHGRDSLVLISANEYARLKALDEGQSLFINELDDEAKAALETARAPEFTHGFNDEYPG